jgi:NTE family protein
MVDGKIKIGLALSGGAARGMAHLGVARALYERGIYPDIISGTSSGAIVGVFLADGFDPGNLCEMFAERKLFEFVNLSLRKQGFLKAAGLRELIKNNIKAKTIEELRIPFYASVTNMNTGLVEYWNKGNIEDIVLASSSIPIVFTPVEMNNALYCDGGILDNLPVKPIINQCDKLIGVHVNYAGPKDNIKGLKMITERAFRLSIGRGIPEIGEQCDLYIEPKGLAPFGLLELGKGREMFEIGYNAANELLDKFALDGEDKSWRRLFRKVKKIKRIVNIWN